MTNSGKDKKAHSMLSPSSSSIWLECTASAAMSALIPDEDTEFSIEGTEAHKLAEHKVLSRVLGQQVPDIRPRLSMVDDEMETCTDMYASYVQRIFDDAIEEGYFPDVKAEQRLDLSWIIPEGKGTADLVMVYGDTLRIIDFKYGANKTVDHENNTQMMIYALGAMHEAEDSFGRMGQVEMTVFQPRKDNVGTFSMSAEDLLRWGEETLRPKAEEAYVGGSQPTMGKHCENCKARDLCRAYREKGIENMRILAENLSARDKATRNLLSPEEISEVLDLSDGLSYWIDQIKKKALDMALDGNDIPGYKLVEKTGPSRLDESAARKIEELGIDPWKPREMKSKTAIKSEVGARMFKESIEPLLVDGDKRPALVRNDDKGDPKSAGYFKGAGATA